MPLPESFSTARLRAERLAPHHLRDLEALHLDPAVMAELGGIRGERETSEYLDRNLHHWSDFDFGVWMLREIDGTDVVGRAILRHLDLEGADEVEVGFTFHQRCWGRGLATEIGERCVGLAREELGLSSLVGVTTLENHASQRVLVKLGLEPEGEVSVAETPCLRYRIRWPVGD
jgi:RimJ/RimL family protein N-acetyltransferase